MLVYDASHGDGDAALPRIPDRGSSRGARRTAAHRACQVVGLLPVRRYPDRRTDSCGAAAIARVTGQPAAEAAKECAGRSKGLGHEGGLSAPGRPTTEVARRGQDAAEAPDLKSEPNADGLAAGELLRVLACDLHVVAAVASRGSFSNREHVIAARVRAMLEDAFDGRAPRSARSGRWRESKRMEASK